MKRAVTLALALLFIAAPAVAQNSGSTYDWRTGNSYQWSHNSDGSTRVNGSNGRNGTMWNQTIQPNGDQRGVDSRGNSWQYNNSSGNYSNGNGKMCTGKGAYRICN